MKRLIVCCDGTWNTPESATVTNVVKLARAVRPRDRKQVDQIVFYDWGVGTEGYVDAALGGAFGKGIDKNIQDAYRFLSHNYVAGDKLYLIGFSRGAYTVRSLAGMLRNVGLLKKPHADKIKAAYNMYRSRDAVDSRQAVVFRSRFSHLVNIEFMGVWDTVGALGIPLDLFEHHNAKKYSFHDTRISRIIQNACHALAIDEKRKAFKPTIWTTPVQRPSTRQAWFSGVHSDIGGGYRETGLADITLMWIVNKARKSGLAVDMGYLKMLHAQSGEEKLHNSYTGQFRLIGEFLRPVGLTNSDESVHPSVWRYLHEHQRYHPKNLMAYLETRKSRQAS